VAVEEKVRSFGPVAGARDAIVELINRSCRFLDQNRFENWLELFADQGRYRVQTAENVDAGYDFNLILLEGKAQMAEWIGVITNFHQAEPSRTIHVLSGQDIEFIGEDEALSWTGFAAFRTATDGISQLFCVGEYHDKLVRVAARWLIQSREVLLHTSTVTGILQVI